MHRIDFCPACSSYEGTVVVHTDEITRARFLEFSRIKYDGLMDAWLNDIDLFILRCRKCGHCWYRDQPQEDQLSAMYTASRSLLGLENPSREPTMRMRTEMRRLYKLVGRGRPHLLDYGSGFGRWARAAVAEGFIVTAYEPSAMRGAESEAVEFAVVHDMAALKGYLFEAINLEQVLEHVPNPLYFLKTIRGLCSSGAILRVAVPNIMRSYEGRDIWDVWPFDGRRTHTMAPFEHLHGFTPCSLDIMVRRAGFIPVNNLAVWARYPANQMRRLLGTVAPGLGTTLQLLKVA